MNSYPHRGGKDTLVPVSRSCEVGRAPEPLARSTYHALGWTGRSVRADRVTKTLFTLKGFHRYLLSGRVKVRALAAPTNYRRNTMAKRPGKTIHLFAKDGVWTIQKTTSLVSVSHGPNHPTLQLRRSPDVCTEPGHLVALYRELPAQGDRECPCCAEEHQ